MKRVHISLAPCCVTQTPWPLGGSLRASLVQGDVFCSNSTVTSFARICYSANAVGLCDFVSRNQESEANTIRGSVEVCATAPNSGDLARHITYGSLSFSQRENVDSLRIHLFETIIPPLPSSKFNLEHAVGNCGNNKVAAHLPHSIVKSISLQGHEGRTPKHLYSPK